MVYEFKTKQMKKWILNTHILLALLLGIASMANAQWLQVGEDIDGEAEGDYSGESISLSADGSIIAIGARHNGGNGPNSGHVRVYQNTSGTWTQIGADIEGEAEYDESGFAVSLSSDGSIVAIGAKYNNGENGFCGHVRVYQNISGVWMKIGQDIDGEDAGDGFGEALSLNANGNIVAIGARGNDGKFYNAGHVRVYQYISSAWLQIGEDIDGEAEDDHSGQSVSICSDGSVVAIGAPRNSGNGQLTGHVRVFKNVSGTWTQIGEDIDGEGTLDQSGYSLCLNADGSVVAIGAIGNDVSNYKGHARIYQNNSGTWTQIGQDIDGEDEGDWFGWSVSLSSDGSIVAIGACTNDGNGNLSGHVQVHQNISGTWTQIAQDIDGEAEGDRSGYSVSLSADGSIVAIGACFNAGNGIDAGHVRVFNNLTIGTDEKLNPMDVSIYPNPSHAKMTLEGENIQSLKIINLKGQIIRETIVSNDQIHLDFSLEPKGVYLIQVITDKSSALKKVVLQ